MFAERFQSDNWRVLYFGALAEEFTRHQGKTEVEKLVDKKIRTKIDKKEKSNQMNFP